MNAYQRVSLFGQITLLLASTLTVMAGATIAPGLPAMQAAFAAEENADFLVRLVLTLPALFIVLGAPLAGFLIDRFGRKRLLLFSAILYAAAGSSGFFLNSLMLILIGRALLGFAVAGIMTSVTTLIADYFTGEDRARLLGLQASFMALGGVLFLLFGGLLADSSWRYPFLIYLFPLLLLPFIVFTLFEPARQNKEPADAPNIFDFLRSHPALTIIFALAFLGMTTFFMIPVQLPFHLQSISDASGTQSGIVIAASNLFSALVALQYKRFRRRLNFVQIFAVAFALMAAGFAVIGLADNYWLVLMGSAICGLGIGFLLPNSTSWLTAIVPETLRGRAVGGLTMAVFLGQFVSPLYSQPLGTAVGVGNSFLMIAAVLLLIAGLAALGSFKSSNYESECVPG